MGEYENPEAKKAWAKEYIEKQKARNEKTNENSRCTSRKSNGLFA
jgi:hypothetical protein